jgi:methionine sulfoxide reductase heme-binding subunit
MDRRFLPLIVAFVVSAKAVMLGLLLGADLADQLLLASRYTARVAFPLFLLTYSASSLLRLWPNAWTKAAVRYRRQWGLGFAWAHTVHLASLASFNIFIQNMPGLQALAGGGLAYGLMYVMAFTSNNASMRAMGIWWKRVHTAGIHWLWFIFTFSYFGRLFDPDKWIQGAVLFPMCLAALGLRIAAWAKARQRTPSIS